MSPTPSEGTRPARIEPPVTEASAPFWEATRDRRLVLPWCLVCERAFWFPREVCPRCLSPQVEWRPASGQGRVYAFTVEHRPTQLKAVFGDAHYVIALVELDEGVRLMSNIVGGHPGETEVGLPVTVTWEPMSDGRHLVLFTPADDRKDGTG